MTRPELYLLMIFIAIAWLLFLLIEAIEEKEFTQMNCVFGDTAHIVEWEKVK